MLAGLPRWQWDPGSGFEGVVPGKPYWPSAPADSVDGSTRAKPASGPEKAPEYQVSLEPNERNFLSLPPLIAPLSH